MEEVVMSFNEANTVEVRDRFAARRTQLRAQPREEESGV